MPYAAQADLLNRTSAATLVQLSCDDGTARQNDTVVNGALVSASGIVDSAVRNRYQVPLQPSAMVTEITADIALYRLYGRRAGTAPELVRQRYEDAMAMLDKVSAGKWALDQPVGAAAPQSTSAGAVLPTCQNLRFTDCDLQGFV